MIRIGSDRERVYVDGAPDPLYVPEEGAAEAAEIFAEATGGETFDEDELGQAIEAARRGAGEGGPQSRVERDRAYAARLVCVCGRVPPPGVPPLAAKLQMRSAR